ncbi:Inositol monophosphatase [Nitratireductor basaltis]|uniref:Inositol monophosphatase n=1 Tax=Nitratireductor basaltis TaxID=472175 RepID=A0A084UD99_9HYPH|nr:Inositol monophosphatase [Nitratireductor basaltis]
MSDSIPAAEELELLSQAAREAGEIAMRYFGQNPEVWMKGGTSPVSEADFAVDKYLQEVLTRARPGYGWLSEETADDLDRLKAPRTFVVDPIDGTRAYIDGRDVWCVSIGLVEDGRTIAGVLECPAKKEHYTAALGHGAYVNGKPMAVRQRTDRLVVGGPNPMIKALPDEARDLIDAHPYVPSLAYRIALVACGTMDATFVKPNAHDWDLAAADLMLSEAGGEVRDAKGARPRYAGPSHKLSALAAGSGEFLDDMVEALARVAQK